MKKLGFLIAGVSLLMSGALTASIRPCPGQFSFTVEWTYLEPIVDNPYYVIKDQDFDDVDEFLGQRIANDMNYDSGFRIEALYAFCNCACPTDLRLAWTHLDADHSVRKRTRDDDLFPTRGHPDCLEDDLDFASSSICFDFDRVEGVFGLHVLDCGCLNLVLEVGLQYANFEYDTKIRYSDFAYDDFYRVVQDSSYWGIGPQFGFDFNYYICGNLSLNATVNWALLVGENDTKFIHFKSGEEQITIRDICVAAKNDSIWRIVPATHMRTGLNYGFGCGCWDANIEVGYQFYSYVRALDHIEFVESEKTKDAPGQVGRSLDIYSNADMHGPYLAFTFNF